MYSSEPLNDFASWSERYSAEVEQSEAEFQSHRDAFMKAARNGDAASTGMGLTRRDWSAPLGHGNYATRPEMLFETVRDVVECDNKLALRLVQLLLGSANNGDKVAAELVADIANAYAENQQ